MPTSKRMTSDRTCDVAVIGAGLAGLIAAWASVRAGYSTLHIAPLMAEPDGRTTALLEDSISFLKELDLWESVSGNAFPLKTMRIIDATDRLMRAPQVDFRSSEVDLEAFGYNLENAGFAKLLADKLADEPAYRRLETSLEDMEVLPDGTARMKGADGSLTTARIVIAADGRKSVVRQSLNITDRQWHYPQIALVGNFTHTLPHDDVSTEFHTRTGPLTLVPLGRNRSSMVCVVNPELADELKALSAQDLNRTLETRMQSVLGKITLESGVKSFPLSGMVAASFGKGPVMLVGEAAHVFPPIGAQGLNLALRDIREAMKQARRALSTDAVSSLDVGAAYHRARIADINSRTASVDMLNRSLLSDLLPVQMVRSAGLYALGTISPLRRFAMREGVAPGLSLRTLARDIADGLKPRNQRKVKSDHSA